MTFLKLYLVKLCVYQHWWDVIDLHSHYLIIAIQIDLLIKIWGQDILSFLCTCNTNVSSNLKTITSYSNQIFHFLYWHIYFNFNIFVLIMPLGNLTIYTNSSNYFGEDTFSLHSHLEAFAILIYFNHFALF